VLSVLVEDALLFPAGSVRYAGRYAGDDRASAGHARDPRRCKVVGPPVTVPVSVPAEVLPVKLTSPVAKRLQL